MNFSITNGKEMRLTKEERLYAGLQFWRLKTEYWYSRFQRASEGRRKWRKEAKKWKDYAGYWFDGKHEVMEELEDIDLKRVGWKTLVTVLLGVIAVLLISWG